MTEEDSIRLARIEEHLKYVVLTIDRIEASMKVINGRVKALELWRAAILGSFAVVSTVAGSSLALMIIRG